MRQQVVVDHFASVDGPAGRLAGSDADGRIDGVTDGAALEDSTRSTINRRQPRPSCTQERFLPIMSQRKPLAALAAATAALALAVPAASASAATFGPGPVVPRPLVSPVVYTPSAVLCSSLVFQLNVAELAANPILANAIGGTLMDMGCGGAAI
jgi:hypothetical protein